MASEDAVPFSLKIVKIVEGLSPTGRTYKTAASLLPLIEKRSFQYADEGQRIIGMRTLLALLRYCLHVVDSAPHDFRPALYRLIINILQRAEFSLDCHSFRPEVADPSCPAEKLHWLFCFRREVVNSFLQTKSKLLRKGTFRELASFNAQVLAIVFFKLPLLCGSILNAISQTLPSKRTSRLAISPRGSTAAPYFVDQDLAQYLATTKSNAEKTSQDSIFIDNVPNLFRWIWFHRHEEDLKLLDEVSTAPTNKMGFDEPCQRWLQGLRMRLQSRSTFFATFLVRWLQCVVSSYEDARIETSKDFRLVWTSVPGYSLFAKMFVLQLESMLAWRLEHLNSIMNDVRSMQLTFDDEDTGSYWTTVAGQNVLRGPSPECDWTIGILRVYTATSVAMLANEELLPLFMRTLFRFTDANNAKSVESSLDLLKTWILHVAKTPGAVVAEVAEEVNADVETADAPAEEKAEEGAFDDTVGEATVGTGSEKERKPRFAPLHSGYRATAGDFRFSEQGRSLPASFDMDFFIDVIGKLLDSMQFQIVLKSIEFLYNVLPCFHGERRLEVLSRLVLKRGERFFRLFLHWNYEVRRWYMSLLLYRFCRTNRLVLPCRVEHGLAGLKFAGPPSPPPPPPPPVEDGGTVFDEGEEEAGEEVEEEESVPRRMSFGMWKQSKTLFTRAATRIGGTLGKFLAKKRRHTSALIEERRNNIFEHGLERESISLDFVLVSRLDSYLQAIMDVREEQLQAQKEKRRLIESGAWRRGKFPDQCAEPLASKGLREACPLVESLPRSVLPYARLAVPQYQILLREYFAIARQVNPDEEIPAPEMTFEVMVLPH